MSAWYCYRCGTTVPLPHLCPQPDHVITTSTTTNSSWHGQVNYELTAAILTALQEAIDELTGGEHATSSRDFGRGVAHATRVIAGAVAAAIEINVNDLTVPEEGL